MTSSRPPRSRSSMFIAPPTRSPSTSSSSSSSRPTLFSKIGALRRVSSFSSLSSRTPSPTSTPTAPSSPDVNQNDAYDTLPQDIPRSSSVMSWFSSDEETDSSRRAWRIPRLRRKTRVSPKNPTFTFTTSASSLSAEEITPCSSLGSPLNFSSEPTLLPAVHPIELDLALDFDCAFPRPYDSDDSDPSSPPFTPAFHPMPQYIDSSITLKRPRESVCWYDNQSEAGEGEEEEDSRTLYAHPSSSDASPGPSSPWFTRSSNSSPEMTEADSNDFEDDPMFRKFTKEGDEAEEDDTGNELDEGICQQLAAFRILPKPPALIATPRTPSSLRSSSSNESLLDPHFDSPSSPSPTTLYSPTFSPNPIIKRERTKTEFSFPLPPTSSPSLGKNSQIKTISFLGLEIEEDDDSPWFDCNP
ncbi:hypothetical protein JCM3765_003044 [Sporobolomyces pararoseus]